MTDNVKHAGPASRSGSVLGRTDVWAGGAGISRRQLLGGAAALAAGLAVSASPGRALAAWSPSRIRLTLPAPTGPHGVGTVSLHLVDHSRQDPWWTSSHPRELMVSVWYPARDVGRCQPAPWMPSGALTAYRAQLSGELELMAKQLGLGDAISLDGVDFPTSHAGQCPPRPPVERSGRRYPVVLYSPGLGLAREMGTVLVEDLASHGYIVVTIDHTYDAGEVEFPGRRVELARPFLDDDGHLQVSVRYADVRFVLDRLDVLAAGGNPDAERRLLPAGLRGALDLARIGIFGHSLGGATAAQAMAHDDRIVAGIDLDGSIAPDVAFGPGSGVTPDQLADLVGSIAVRVGNRPFMIMTSGGQGPDVVGDLLAPFWHHLGGWRRFLSLTGSTHGSYTDEMPLIHQLAAAGVTPAGLASIVGTIDPGRAIAVERAYIGAFFDLWLRDEDSHLLDGPSSRYPEIIFFPPV